MKFKDIEIGTTALMTVAYGGWEGIAEVTKVKESVDKICVYVQVMHRKDDKNEIYHQWVAYDKVADKWVVLDIVAPE